MNIETINISELHADPANARKHSPRNVDAIKASLARFGQQKPIVVDANNVVLAGNGTLEAARSLGWKELRIVRTALTGSNATAYAIADNRTGELAEWNDDVLSRLLAEPDIGDVGFDDAEIRKLLGSVDDTPLVPIDDCYQVVVECKDDADQKRVYEEMKGRGYECRLLMI